MITFHTSSVIYFGVFLDEHLYWDNQLAHAIAKLNQVIGILGKLRHGTNINILKIVYYSVVGSHLHLWCPVMGPDKQKILTKYKCFRTEPYKAP